MSVFFPGFFESNEYFIDEKRHFLKLHNEYRVYDPMGLHVGSVVQRLSKPQKLLRLLLRKRVLPFHLELTDANNVLLASMHRGWAFFLSRITIFDEKGMVSGSIQQKFKLIRPRFIIFDARERRVAEIKGDWKAWSFTITDARGNRIGTINKKWGGMAREFFTTADKYHVTIEPSFAEDRNKMNIVVTAITIDMVLKESQ
ncbi:MAG TPA: phospholipid scramblase-related protein [Flavisolibacter sp.]|nr:phospholipid scramblase-related protein [Flavisolibacter sp.]